MDREFYLSGVYISLHVFRVGFNLWEVNTKCMCDSPAHCVSVSWVNLV